MWLKPRADWARPGKLCRQRAFLLKEWVPNDHILVEKNPRFYDAANVALKQVIYLSDRRLWRRACSACAPGELDFQDRTPPDQQIAGSGRTCRNTHPAGSAADRRFHRPSMSTASRSTISAYAKPSIWRSTAKRYADRVLRAGPCAGLSAGTARHRQLSRAATASAFRHAFHTRSGWTRRAALMQARRLQCRQPGQDDLHDPRNHAGHLSRGRGRHCSRCWRRSISISPSCPTTCMMFYPTRSRRTISIIAQSGWVADFNDAATFLDLFTTGNGNNWGEYSNPAFDAMMAAASRTPIWTSRGRKLAAAEAILLEDHAAGAALFFGPARISSGPMSRA